MIEADDGHGLSLEVLRAHDADAEVRGKRGDARNRPGEAHQLRGGLAGLVAHDDTAADAQIPVPPGLVEAPGVRRDAKLDKALLVRLGADRLQARSQGVDMAGDHGEAVARLKRLANTESDNRAAVAADEVLYHQA